MRHRASRKRWAVLWHSENKLNGKTVYFISNEGEWMLFRTRQQAREWNEKEHGFIKGRPDLRGEPHGWRMPKIVRVVVTVTEE
jgi:hypothetical protein